MTICGRPNCSRPANGHGAWCCGMCRLGYGTHSVLCRRRNERKS